MIQGRRRASHAISSASEAFDDASSRPIAASYTGLTKNEGSIIFSASICHNQIEIHILKTTSPKSSPPAAPGFGDSGAPLFGGTGR